MAGVFGTSFDELNDGHANAAVFVPILSQAYEQNAELKQQLLRAVNDRLPIVPVAVSKQYAPCGWVAMYGSAVFVVVLYALSLLLFRNTPARPHYPQPPARSQVMSGHVL